ncbi:TetR/AcrR family transcriptional regulator [Streptacidiphilus sp. ASG 303]|uniref:TetR/AcrR family transcriptional regulator n=1 Tax=Streptacidiphilus sp. ASG 303 TaxID=2896847 RepID=UPI00272BD4BA|nr:TetR/AcrR family transcriptional regulator [Streptacidiphilus sp. ASG 303]
MDQQERARARLSAAVGTAEVPRMRGPEAGGLPPRPAGRGGAEHAVPEAGAARQGLAEQGGSAAAPGQWVSGGRYGRAAVAPGPGPGTVPDVRPAGFARAGGRLRVDARRNLESVLRAAREVFGELGYGAPMEEVARRAGVGVGTVYRRFPSKDALVRRIAAEEVAWLTARAREALHGGSDPWEALAGYLSRAVATGAGRLLPPEAFRQAERMARGEGAGTAEGGGTHAGGAEPAGPAAGAGGASGQGVVAPGTAAADGAGGDDAGAWSGPDTDPVVLLDLLDALVGRADAAGVLRAGVTVADVVLVLTAAVPSYPAAPAGAAGPGGAPSERLLRILLHGLRTA